MEIKFENFSYVSDIFPLKIDTSNFSNFLITSIRSLLTSGTLYYKSLPVYPTCIEQYMGESLTSASMLNVDGKIYSIKDLARGSV